MPEEKVKQYECLCPCEHKTGCIACENGNHDYHIVPPAADAGPRCTCSHNYADHSAVRNHYCMMAGCPCERYELLANPPVPQEAAPRHINHNCTNVLPTTAPQNQQCTCDPMEPYGTPCHCGAADSAMRAAEQIKKLLNGWNKPESPMSAVAALIREAGSEWERRLATKLREACGMMKVLDREAKQQAVTDFLTEASRLLGGESK